MSERRLLARSCDTRSHVLLGCHLAGEIRPRGGTSYGYWGAEDLGSGQELFVFVVAPREIGLVG